MNILAKLNKRERTIVYALVGIVISGLAYNFLLEPLFKGFGSIDRETKLSRVKLQKALSLIKRKPEIDKEYALYDGEDGRLLYL